ncbi:MAG: acyl-CoA dehydrogenase [Deltaproteobacteria bacterium]|nr:acyl-CoA dehydrogenase [Deltaproteobacteria bacterium]MBW1847492.1 acyl-CoA dehydrogenase [Deltaproteobacteria bacterium]MBW1970538.1 acyl-CoA dehydrogenase [Deltaproteobacteria bacterium]MBW2181432.1 acyl-CoA dehydrogenase [Deltaproteobacteria bacterium]
MAQQLVDKKDIDFVLWEQFGFEELLKKEEYKEFNKKTCEMIITEARALAIKELLPTLAEGDKEGLKYENGKVIVPECFKRPHQLLLEGEWGCLGVPEEMGGQGAPSFISAFANEYFMAASWAVNSYAAMGNGTAAMIHLYGTPEQKDKYVKKLVSGEWGGTMLLTESNAGSDVGALETTAKKNDDGTYTITGNKIFITNGDHNLCENIVHPVLARIEGAPKGIKGVSLFLVPNYFVNGDGGMGERNDVICTGVEHKHGLKGSATCSMALGSKGKCIGELLGEENKGMRVMFTMVNGARMHTGLQALSYASASYLLAVNYARERIQFRELGHPSDAPPVAIINHPDVRRNLLWMKSYVDGMHSFFHYVEKCGEMANLADSDEDKELYNGQYELLTPIIKSFIADRGYQVCVQGIQVFGGAGYTQDYLVEQYARDCKITSIYEGTSGIQAMDLLGRKLGMKEGKVFTSFLTEIGKTAEQAKKVKGLEDMAESVEALVGRLGEISIKIGKTATSPDTFKVAFAHSLPFLNVMGDIIIAWMLLWRAVVAAPKVGGGASKKDQAFYEGQVKTAEFYMNTVVPTIFGQMDSIEKCSPAAIAIGEDAFGGL